MRPTASPTTIVVVDAGWWWEGSRSSSRLDRAGFIRSPCREADRPPLEKVRRLLGEEAR